MKIILSFVFLLAFLSLAQEDVKAVPLSESARRDPEFNLALMAEGDLAVEREDYLSALQFYREVDRSDELRAGDLDLMLRLAKCYDAMGRYWASYAIYDSVITKFPESPEVESSRYAAFKCLVALGESAAAVELGRSLCAQVPEHHQLDQVKYLMGTTLFRSQDYEGALALFEEVALSWPDRLYAEDSTYWAGMCSLFMGQYDEAMAVFDGYLTNSTWKVKRFESDVAYRLGVARYGLRDYEVAEKIFQDFIVRFPTSDLCSEAYSMLGESKGADGELELALEDYDRARACSVNIDQNSHAVFQTARILELLERHEDIVALMTVYLQEQGEVGQFAEASLWMSKSLRTMGDADAALDVGCKTLASYGNDPRAKGLERVAEALIAQARDPNQGSLVLEGIKTRLDSIRASAIAEEKQEALALLLTALFSQISEGEERAGYVDFLLRKTNFNVFCPFALMVFAEEASKQGEPTLVQKSIEYFMNAFASSDLMLQMVNIQLAAWIESKEYDRALTLAQDTLTRYPSDRASGQTQKLAADSLRLMARYEEAISMYEHLLTVREWRGPLTPQALYWIGICTLEQGNPTRASAYFQRVYVLYTQYPEWTARAYAGSVRCLQSLGRRRQAIIRTWQEMVSIPEVAKTPEGRRAQEELEALQEGVQ